MKRLFIAAGASVLMLLPITSFLAMWEVVTFPRAHNWMGYFVLGYLLLILVCLTGEMARDVWRWLTNRL